LADVDQRGDPAIGVTPNKKPGVLRGNVQTEDYAVAICTNLGHWSWSVVESFSI
jgi:hypothetical protein